MKLKSRKNICPVCSELGYGPYVEWVHDKAHRCYRRKIIFIHRIIVGGRYRTVKTCVVKEKAYLEHL